MDVFAVSADVLGDFGLGGGGVADEADYEVGWVGGELAEEFELCWSVGGLGKGESKLTPIPEETPVIT